MPGAANSGRATVVHFAVWVACGVGLAGLGAVLLFLAFPPYDLWPLILVGFVPVVVSLHRVMPARCAGLALGVGVGGFFLLQLDGIFTGIPAWRWLPLMIALAATGVGFWERRFNRRTGYRYLIPAGASFWVALEMVRGSMPFVGTWGFVSYALYEQPWLIQPVSVFSIYGLSMLIMLVNFALAAQVMAWMDRRRRDASVRAMDLRAVGRWTLAVAVAVASWVGLSAVLLDDPPPGVQVVALQPGAVGSLDELFELNREAAAVDPAMIVWPEGFLPFDPREHRAERFRALARELDTHLVIGYAVTEDAGLRNEVTVLSPGGEFLGAYGKDHPVLFGGETSLTRGAYPTFATGFGQLGVIICYDLDFTDTARRVTQSGARIIAVPSADWPAIAHRHYTHLVFRAVENRVAVVKADTGYDSAIVDPFGRILTRSVSSEPTREILTANVPLGSGRAPAVGLGDWMGWVAVSAALLFVVCDAAVCIRRR